MMSRSSGEPRHRSARALLVGMAALPTTSRWRSRDPRGRVVRHGAAARRLINLISSSSHHLGSSSSPSPRRVSAPSPSLRYWLVPFAKSRSEPSVTEALGAKYFGASVKRREDPRFLRGEGRFVDDVKLAGMLHVAFLRSPYAHARIVSLRTEAAAAMPGVVRVFTFRDLERWMKPLPIFGAVPPGLAAAIRFDIHQPAQYALCPDRARYVGEIVAMVVARTATAPRTRGRHEVEWEPLPAVVDMQAGAERGPPRARAGATTSPSASRTPSATWSALCKRGCRHARDIPHPALRRHASRGARLWWRRGSPRRSLTT